MFVRDQILSIEWPNDGQDRMRKVVARSNARSTSKYASWKVGRMVQCESRNESNCCLILDSLPEVRSYAEQPCKIRYYLDGAERTHVPDFVVHYDDKRRDELWEVKPKKALALPEYQRRTDFLSSTLPLHGFDYRTVSAETLSEEPRLSNLKELRRHGISLLRGPELERSLDEINARGGIKWQDAQEDRQYLAALAGLVSQGYLIFDMQALLGPETVLRVTDELNWRR